MNLSSLQCNRASLACFIGTLAAVPGSGTLRAIRMPASNPTSRVVERLSLAAVPYGPCAIHARGGTVRAAGASRHRAARAREVLAMESFLGRAGCGETRRWRSSKSNAPERGSTAFANLVSGKRILHAGEDPLLRGAGQLADALEYLSGFSRRPAAAPAAVPFAQEMIHGDVEDGAELDEVFRLERRLAALPARVTRLRDASFSAICVCDSPNCCRAASSRSPNSVRLVFAGRPVVMSGL